MPRNRHRLILLALLTGLVVIGPVYLPLLAGNAEPPRAVAEYPGPYPEPLRVEREGEDYARHWRP